MPSRRAAQVGGRTGITSSSRSAIDRLPSYKRNYVKSRVEGKSIQAAAAENGMAASTGSRYDKESDVQAAYRELMQKAIPASKLVKLIKGGTEAKTPVFNTQGRKVGERADWKTRKPYIEMASKHAGYYEDKNSGNGGTSITFVVNHIGKQTTSKIIEAQVED